MKIVAFVLVSLVALIPPADAGSASQTFPVSLDRAWSTTEKVLDVLGWEIDKSDRTVGWLTTDSRKLDGEDYGVYAKGTRHTVERSVFKREHILWIDTDEPLATQDQTVERGVLAAIGKSPL